jgi:hypothetical protein
MPSSIFPIDGRAGVNLAATYVSAGAAPFALGTSVRLNDGGTAMLIESSASACSTFAAVVINESYVATMLTTGVARSAGNMIGFAQTSIATGYCGWVQFGGRPKANLAANCAPFVPLFTTATAGVLDDATVSGSGGMVMGVFAAVSISNATAVTCIANTGSHFVNSAVGS